MSESGIVPLSDMVEIICELKGRLHLVSGNVAIDTYREDERVDLYGIHHTPRKNMIFRIFAYIWLQCRLAFGVAKAPSQISNFLFFVGGPTLLPGILIAKLKGGKVNIMLSGSDIKSIRAESRFLALPIRFLVFFSLHIADNIIVYSDNIIEDMGLEKYDQKIYTAHRHFLDFSIFKKEKDFKERDEIIGYIGRFSYEKGFEEFIKALPKILSLREDVKVRIIGDGDLKDEAIEFIRKKDLKERVEFIDWIPHDEIPKILNEMKLLVMPSLTEGLPNVMLEAMACGTLVLASPVGAIPDIIDDSQNGFLIRDRSPRGISAEIKRCLNREDLEEISGRALVTIKRDFSFDNVVKSWHEILERLND